MSEAAVDIPVDAGGHLPPYPVLLRFLELQSRTGIGTVALPRWPGAHPQLPPLLALAGIDRLRAPVPARGWPRNWHWVDPDGGRIQVTASSHGRGGGPDHAAPIPLTRGAARSKDSRTLYAQCALARYEDAAAVVGGGDGAAWNLLLASIARPTAPPPVASRSGDHDGAIHAWNPLPLSRRCSIAVGAAPGSAPWGLRDQDGRSYPIQLAEGPLGRQFLSVIDLGPLECRRLEPLDDPVPGAHWEVSPRVLDNGRVRAEFDASGAITRLCLDGRFLPLTAPMPRPWLDGNLFLPIDTTVSVLEDGPVRARIAVCMEHGDGVLTLIYSLYAEERLLRIGVSWRGTGELELEHATAWRSAPGRVWWDGAHATVEQVASLRHPDGHALADVRCLALGAGGPQDAELGLIALAFPLDLRMHDGRVLIRAEDGGNYAIAAARPDDGWPLPLLGLAAAEPGRSAVNATASPPPFRLHGGEDLVPLWVRRREDGRTELTLFEATGRRGSARLALGDTEAEPAVIDLAGRVLAEPRPAELPGQWELRYRAHQVLIVAW